MVCLTRKSIEMLHEANALARGLKPDPVEAHVGIPGGYCVKLNGKKKSVIEVEDTD
jgi:hypothetical protein